MPIFLGGPMGPIHPVWANGPKVTEGLAKDLTFKILVPIAPPRVDSSKGPKPGE